MPMNYARTALLLALLTAILVAMGAVVGGQTGMLIAFAAALVMNLISLWKSDTLVLRMFKAREVDELSAPGFYRLVQQLAVRAELPMPRVYIMDNPQPNAFATGRSPSNSAVCASTGLLDMLTEQEIAGVMAHELAHIKNRDTLTMTVAATIGGAISMLAQYLQFGMIFGRSNGKSGPGFVVSLLAMLVAPMAATMVQMAISRSREYQADRMGALIAGNPRWLSSALLKINEHARRIRNTPAEQVPAAAHLFIINPLSGRGMDSLFSTHPHVDNRVAELEALYQEMASAGQLELDDGQRRMAERSEPAPWQGLPQRRSDPSGPWS